MREILKSVAALMFIMLLSVSSIFAAKPVKIPSPGGVEFKRAVTNNNITYKPKVRFKRTFFVDAKSGNDENDGRTSATAFKSLKRLETAKLRYGDCILLRGDQIHKGTIELVNLNAKPAEGNSMIHIGSYGEGKARINFAGYPAGVWIENSSNISIADIKMSGNGGPDNAFAMIRKTEKHTGQRYGIRIVSTPEIEQSVVSNIKVYNVDIANVFLLNPVDDSRACKQWDMGDQMGWGWGVYGEVLKGKGIRNIELNGVTVSNVSNIGIRFKGSGSIDGRIDGNVNRVLIEGCTIYQSGGPGMQFNKTNNSAMRYCRITESGSRNDNRKWGRGSGMWTWGCNKFLLEYNTFEGAQGIADCCGAHIDFNCSDVIIQYCVSRYNAGGFIEILGRNNNCAYRYNVSINDGWRNLRGDEKVQKFWGDLGIAGCLLTVNGHSGKANFEGPYNSYVYNNTIICTEKGAAPYTNPYHIELATSNRGVLVMNNIFWLDKKASTSWSMHRWKGDKPYEKAVDFKISDSKKSGDVKPDAKGTYPAEVRPMNEAELAAMNLVMKNNIYKLIDDQQVDRFARVANALADGYWDDDALGGDPDFVEPAGTLAADFIPRNAEAVERGAQVEKLSTDKSKLGLFYGGLQVKRDIFGNPIKHPIVGAIVPNTTRKRFPQVDFQFPKPAKTVAPAAKK